MQLLCVEDDHIIAKPLIDELTAAFPQAEINWIGTESDFHLNFDQIALNPPNVVTLDVMKLWAVPNRDTPSPPDEVRKGGINRAGVRCAKMLNQDDRTKNVPIILYTVIEEESLKSDLHSLRNCYYVSKEWGSSKLIEKIKSLSLL